MDTDIAILGHLTRWPSKDEVASILRDAGLTITVGEYSIRFEDCEYFVFQEYGGDLGSPCITAGADSIERSLHDAGVISRARADANIRHRFALYDDADEMVAYLHHNWPEEPDID